MTPLTQVLDSYFKKKFLVIIAFMLLFSIIVNLFIGYFKGRTELKSNLDISSSIYSSLFYSKDWDLLNKFSSVLNQEKNVSLIEIQSKENGRILYKFDRKRLLGLPAVCMKNDTSEVLVIKMCREVIAVSDLIFSLVALLFFSFSTYLIL